MAIGTRARTTLDWALTYATLGWRVFPVVPGGKKPMPVASRVLERMALAIGLAASEVEGTVDSAVGGVES